MSGEGVELSQSPINVYEFWLSGRVDDPTTHVAFPEAYAAALVDVAAAADAVLVAGRDHDEEMEVLRVALDRLESAKAKA